MDEMREKRCTWTLKGWKDTDEDGNEIMRATEEGGDSSKKKEDGENGGMEVDDDKENDAGKDNIDDGNNAVSRFFEKMCGKIQMIFLGGVQKRLFLRLPKGHRLIFLNSGGGEGGRSEGRAAGGRRL